MIWITWTWLVWLAAGVLCEVPSPPTNFTGTYLDLCNQGLIQLKGVNETGKIGFDSHTAQQKPTPCVVKIESCPTCQIIIEPASFENFAFYCQTGVPRLKHQCSLGCDYLYMFDVYYLNETMRLIQTWNQTMTPFQSESSGVFIVLCHGPTDYQFTLRYRTVKKVQSIHGTTRHNTRGAIHSPFFPVGYHQNFETYEFVFSSSGKGEFIALSFDDWNLDSSSAFYFEDSNINGPVYGSTFRPNVISNYNQMKVLFNTGQPILSTEQRGNMGFKAVYTFISSRDQFRNSKTSCKGAGYLLDSVGGQIEFTKETQPEEYFDCIWVVKTQLGFQGTYLKLMKKRLPADDESRYRRNQIQIRSGLTSDGHLFSTIYKEMSPSDYQAHVDEVGFYVRINSTVSPSDSVVLVYASYKNTYVSNCKHDSSLFACNNGRCIDKKLVCDGYDHCGDNYDETHGCSYDDNNGMWDKSYQYTITIGVIVPMVISVFLIMVICLLFVMIRRCRRARLREAAGMNERLETVSAEVSTTRRGRRRRRRRRFFGSLEPENPPTYDEAIQSPPGWYDNVAFGTAVDPTLPQPPSYTEAIENMSFPTAQPLPLGSPSSTDSSQSGRMSINNTHQSSSSSSEGGSSWEIGRRQLRSSQQTETSHVSSSDSETDDVETPTSPETRNRNMNSVVEGQSDISTAPPDTHDRNRKELQKADRLVHKQRSDKTVDKHSNKIGPGPSNCVIPDTNNKVRSSRSMELLPSMSLTYSSIDTDSETAEPLKGNRLRTGGPQSPLNGSCPALSRNLTIFGEESASAQPNPTNTYHPQLQQEQNRSRNDISKYETRHEEQGYNGPKINSRNTEVVNRDSKNNAPNDNEQSEGQGQNVMVVYDGPHVAAPSPNQSPSRTNAYLLSSSLGTRETGAGRNSDNQSSSYHGNSGNQLDADSPTQKQCQETDQRHRKDTVQNQRKQKNQLHQQKEDNNTKRSNGSNSRPVDRRLAHLPIINQMRKTGENSSALQNENRDRDGGRINDRPRPEHYGHHGNVRHVPGPNFRNERNIPRADQTDHRSNISRPNSSDHAGHNRNRSRPEYDSRHGNERNVSRPDGSARRSRPVEGRTSHPGNESNISRPDETGHYRNDRHSSRPNQSHYHGNKSLGSGQAQASESETVSQRDGDRIRCLSSDSPSHRGQSNEESNRCFPGGFPPAAMATGHLDGAVDEAQNLDSEESVGYLNLYRVGGEADDIYV